MVVGFNIDAADPHYVWRMGLADLERKDRRMLSGVEIILIELPKFKRLFEHADVNELQTPLEKWLYFLIMCNTKEKLERFLSVNPAYFSEYESKIERVSTMDDFTVRYRKSLVNTIEFMTPAEELEYFKAKMDKELKGKDKALKGKDRELKANAREIAELRKKLEALQAKE